MKNFRVLRLGCSQNRPDAVLDRILKIAGERHVPTNLLHEGKEEQIGAVSVYTLHPRTGSGLASSNENSVVLQFSYGRFSALLPGDLERAGEREFLERTPDLRCRLLKVAHHGSRSGTSRALLDKTRPQWAVISVGRNNPFGHPSPEVMARLRLRGTQPYLTLDEGAITLETDGTRYVIKSYVRGILEQGDIR
jgi:competence protein ComEC